MIEILNTVVGSQAHGTSTPESDVDSRVIFVEHTEKIVGIGNYDKFVPTTDGTDKNSWELAHFIYLTLRCNPTTLEVLLAPPLTTRPWGDELRELFPAFLNRRHVYNAFKGFANGQRKKMISHTTNYFRKPKAASHFLRVLYNGIELLQTGTMTVRIIDTPIGEYVLAAKLDQMLFEEVLVKGDELLAKIDAAYEASTLPLESDKHKINQFLIYVRRNYWENDY